MAEPASAIRNVAEALATWLRDERHRVGDAASENVGAVLRELGFVTRGEYENLELRVAQLEHRIRLLESAATESAAAVTLEGGGAAGDTEPRAAL
jgi:BMFP domain-containing protein YqiC